jgi:hypothetical protein
MPKKENHQIHQVMRSERARGARHASVAAQRDRDVLRRMQRLLEFDNEGEFVSALKDEFGISETSPNFAAILQAWRARR